MPTILVAEDSAVDRRLIAGILDQHPGLTVQFADNGLDALAKLDADEPDLVVTDLQMPKMDGLKLVQAIGLHHDGVPVILITGKGSEDIAVEALAHGAASYVPKVQLNDRLHETITNVLARSRADRSYERLIQCATHTEFSFHLDNDPALIDPLVELSQQIVLSMGVCGNRGRLRVGVALEQAISNAMVHGNLELSYEDLQQSREALMQGDSEDVVRTRRGQSPYCDRKIHVQIRITHDEARFIVRDEGKGFDVNVLPESSDADEIAKQGGRGLVLMNAFMDEVAFNDCGNEVTLVKRRETE